MPEDRLQDQSCFGEGKAGADAASRYAAAVGAVHDLLYGAVASGHAERAPALREDAVDAVLTLLQIPRV